MFNLVHGDRAYILVDSNYKLQDNEIIWDMSKKLGGASSNHPPLNYTMR